MSKTLVLLSGGMDSSVLLKWLVLEQKQDCACLFINWSQSSLAREHASAVQVARESKVALETIDISSWRQGCKDRFNDWLKLPRNAIFGHIALPYVIANQCDCLAVGSTPEDAQVTDSNAVFFEELNNFWRQMNVPVKAVAPFLEAAMTKEQIIRWSDEKLGAEFVDRTTSCWRETLCPQGQAAWCAACIKRDKALQLARR